MWPSQKTLESGIDVRGGRNIAPGTFGRNSKPRPPNIKIYPGDKMSKRGKKIIAIQKSINL